MFLDLWFIAGIVVVTFVYGYLTYKNGLNEGLMKGKHEGAAEILHSLVINKVVYIDDQFKVQPVQYEYDDQEEDDRPRRMSEEEKRRRYDRG